MREFVVLELAKNNKIQEDKGVNCFTRKLCVSALLSMGMLSEANAGYVGGNPLKYVDPKGLDIAIVNNGPTDGNPLGHSAIAVTGSGVYSYGNGTEPGTSLSDYISREAPRRDTDIAIIPTTPEQDQAVINYLKLLPKNLPHPTKSVIFNALYGGVRLDNCATRTSGGMNAAGLPTDLLELPGLVRSTSEDYANSHGGTVITIPQGSGQIPPGLQQFEPNKGGRN